eukprot:Blabericola_migrator_1__11269@NODE_663_length_6971_cov_273_239426_g484_i0_p6_GENE_NODE_663_length_6971_cov_273_239426_g484_i0NODE_663_length_6971_cov_273_239426_g484_i0_p6_ORF_typecomplete_len159_score1_28DUF2070/PF09843_9/2_1_NODE_663_length_6971_cov_273_239426_g484_i053225798
MTVSPRGLVSTVPVVVSPWATGRHVTWAPVRRYCTSVMMATIIVTSVTSITSLIAVATPILTSISVIPPSVVSPSIITSSFFTPRFIMSPLIILVAPFVIFMGWGFLKLSISRPWMFNYNLSIVGRLKPWLFSVLLHNSFVKTRFESLYGAILSSCMC